MFAQAIFGAFYFLMYVFFTKTAHRMIGFFEDEAVKSYSEYLALIERGEIKNVKAPRIAIDYYNLADDARLIDLVKCVKADEEHHSEVNHKYADEEIG